MYIVTYPSMSEWGSSLEVEFLKTYADLQKFLLGRSGDLARVRIFDATELGLKLVVEKKDAAED